MKDLKNALQTIDPESRPWALWIWNQYVSIEAVVAQMKGFIERGFGGVAIRPGRDMVPAYMSAEFLSILETALGIAKENGLGVRIADDFALPWNGFLESQVQSNPELRAQYISLEETIMIEGGDTVERTLQPGDDIIVFAVQYSEAGILPDSIKNLAVHSETGAFSWKAPQGKWKVLLFRKQFILYTTAEYVPKPYKHKTAQAYIKSILEQLKERFSKYIPGTFEGLVSEIPSLLPSEKYMPWEDDLVVKYRSRYKKDMLKSLPLLFLDVADESAKRARSHIYSFIGQSIHERFTEPLETWLRKFRLSQWVLAPERNVYSPTEAMGCSYAIPAIQNLSTVGIQNQDGTLENEVLLKATADLNCIVFRRETVGVVGRNHQVAGATLQSLKTEIDRMALNGSSRILIDGCFLNLEPRSYVRTPYNPSWYHPAWNQMHSLCSYAARMNALMKDTHETRPVALLMPTSSVNADYVPWSSEETRHELDSLQSALMELRRLSIPFDIVTEELLLSSSVRTNGEFGTLDRIRKGNYEAIIVPFTRLINKSIFLFLDKIATKKGKVVFLDDMVQGSLEDGITATFTERIEKLRKKAEYVHVVASEDLGQVMGDTYAPARITVNKKPSRDITVSKYSSDGHALYLFHNVSRKQDHYAEIEIPSSRHLYYIDSETGRPYSLKSGESEENGSFSITFGPLDTILIVDSEEEIPGSDEEDNRPTAVTFGRKQRNYRIVLKNQWDLKPETGNVLPLANWNTRIGLSRESGGFSHYSEAYFELKEPPKSCRMVMGVLNPQGNHLPTGEDIYEVSINGNFVTPTDPLNPKKRRSEEQEVESPFPIDPFSRSLCYDLHENLLIGFNRVTIRTPVSTAEPQLMAYPPVITGAFSIVKGTRGWAIDSAVTSADYDSWTKHGFPYMSGTCVYSQRFEVPSEYDKVVLSFSETSGPVDVTINDTPLGILKWHPMEVDITAACTQKRNEITVRATNTVDNYLRMNGRPSGLLGEVFVDVF